MTRALVALAVVAVVALSASCRQVAEPTDVTAVWTLRPAAPRVGDPVEAQVVLTSESTGGPVRGATLDFEAHMSHPGMAPLIVRTVEREPGRYVAPMPFSMSGDWVVFVSGTLTDGNPVRQRLADVTVVGSE
jgi:hypothetical protein